MKPCKSSSPVSKSRAQLQNLPAKCKMYLNLLTLVKQDKFFNAIPKTIRKKYQNFTSVFRNMDDNERAHFITKNIEYAHQKINGYHFSLHPNIREIETSCQVKTSFMKMTFWEKRNLKYEYNYQRIKLCNSKKQELVDLKSYLVRLSQSEKNTIVLESFDPVLSQKFQKISIKLANSSICGEIISSLRQLITEISFKRIECLLGDDLKDQTDLKLAQEKSNMDLTILTSKNISQYFENKQKLLNKLKRAKREIFGIHSDTGLHITNSSQNPKYYFLDYILPKQWQSMSKIRQNVRILNDNLISDTLTCQKLQKFSPTISANYYKMYAEEEFQLIMIVERVEKEYHLQQIMKSTSNIAFGINVPFMDISISMNKHGQFLLQVSAIIKKNQSVRTAEHQQIVIQFLSHIARPKVVLAKTLNRRFAEGGQFSAMKKEGGSRDEASPLPRARSCTRPVHSGFKDQSPAKQFQLEVPSQKRSSEEEDEKEEIFYSIQDIEELQDNQEIQELCHTISSKIVMEHKEDASTKEAISPTLQSKQDYLTVKAINNPLEKTAFQYISEHNLLIDWKKSAKGGVVCINKEAIEEQKKVVKLAFNQIGSKVFKMKGIINFSLPIQICRCESALVSIARNISHAPTLLETSSPMTPLERLKKLIILQISWCSMALSTQKPFNPILGETYQGFLNGCPIFMQQISHHPAISYLYFVGRGYKIYGQVAPVICLRLNYINAIDEEFMTVEFDNGDICEFSVSTMVINGLIFGERSIYFDGVNYVVDRTNNLIAEIRYNAKNNSLFKSKENPDFLMGEIYQVTSSFMSKFIANGKRIPPKKDDKNRLLEPISGEWNGVLMFDNEKVYDFQKNLPVKLEDSLTPLASDGVFRQDLIHRKLVEMVKGQEQKQRLQELQRNDKKLRNKTKQAKKK